MTKATKKTSPEISAANSEIEAVFLEGMELEHQGKLDEAAINHIDARMKSISERLDKEVDAKVAQIEACYPLPKPVSLPKPALFPLPLRLLALTGLFLVLTGVILEVTIGRRYISSHANEYSNAIPWMHSVLIPIFAVVWFRFIKGSSLMRNRYPTRVIRWVVMYPMLVVLSSTMIVVAPLGWLALYDWAGGIPLWRLHR